jgi:hypothetical protein
MMPMSETAMPTRTITRRIVASAVIPTLKTAIKKPRNVTTTPTIIMLLSPYFSILSASVVLMFQRLALQEEERRNSNQNYPDQIHNDAASGKASGQNSKTN